MNKILEEASISKGAAYYYFDDKADLFATTVGHYAQELMGDLPLAIDHLNATNFWTTIAHYYARQFAYSYEKPWAFGVVKTAARLSGQTVVESGTLAQFTGEALHSLQSLVRKGQEVGAVRTDLPHGLLVSLFIAVDDATDRWLLRHWDELDREEIDVLVRRVLAGLSCFLAPDSEEVS